MSELTRRIVAFGRFWYDFVIGDDWTIAITVVAALLILAWLKKGNVEFWWLLPVVVMLALGASLWRALRST